MKKNDFDILVIGGGINGCGVAKELSARGYKVCLMEKQDLASGTSSWSTKLIHGGLRYLENYEFRLVRESLKEREVLMQIAPHLIRPLRFVLPHLAGMRPKWLLRLGLFFYDNLGGVHLGRKRRLEKSTFVDLKNSAAGKPLKPSFNAGFEYSDCFVDDSRLTILTALAAAEEGAEIRRDCEVQRLNREADVWLAHSSTGPITAKIVINAGGPWVEQIIARQASSKNKARIRLVRGSHVITKRLFEHDKAYIFQNSDGRILFALPYLEDFTLIGTTDIDHNTSPDSPQISAEEIDYICSELGLYLARPISKADIVVSFSGVRPLVNDGRDAAQSVTRDYVLEWQADTSQSWLNIFGGKLTTYRKLSIKVADMVASVLPIAQAEFNPVKPLPGGAIPESDFGQFVTRIQNEFPQHPKKMLTRMAAAYGTRIYQILGSHEMPADLGQNFGFDLYSAEIDYLVDQEWARTADDILLRRTKLSLYFDKTMTEQLKSYLE